MFEEMQSEEIFVFGFGFAVILWSLYRILTSGKYGSSIGYWLLAVLSAGSLWLWRSGTALELYMHVKTVIITPY
ncbi:MAG: hypothetical protein FP816_15515 [Desulfobacteraceae bacterium]|nr:hypothetical protein [Desulfobacteraceae bacterium]MBU4002542.1 hypothetical protein [Pseudomonadota bacterium]